MITATRSLDVLGPFDLARSAGFSFGPKGVAEFTGTFRMAFVLDGYATSVAVAVRQPDPSRLDVSVTCDSEAAVEAAVAQTARILSVDVDARGFQAMAQQDPVLGPLVAAAPGLRPPLFASAYEALAWSVLSARRPRDQMRALRDRLSAEAGRPFELDGEQLVAFPAPAAMLAVSGLPGLPEEKLRRLHGVAQAAVDGRLDTADLRRLPVDEASAVARSLDGIGPFYAELLIVRTLGHTDVLPTAEAQVRGRLGTMLGRPDPVEQSELERLAEPWQPWRTWACVHIRAVDVPAGTPEGVLAALPPR